MRVVIAGGAGALGRRLATDFEGAGHDVVILTRSPKSDLRFRQALWDGRAVGDWASELEGAIVVNLAGDLYLNSGMSPFRIVDRLVEEAQQLAETILVDLHAEATSEKVAMGHYLDGRVTAVVGTHTHVQTSDARVLGGGTAYVTDVGMTGPRDSVIGVRTDIILQRFTTELPQRFEVAEGPVRLNAVLIDSDGGRATSIEAIDIVL